MFYDGQDEDAARGVFTELEAVENANDDFTFLKVDVTAAENVKRAAKVRPIASQWHDRE